MCRCSCGCSDWDFKFGHGRLRDRRSFIRNDGDRLRCGGRLAALGRCLRCFLQQCNLPKGLMSISISACAAFVLPSLSAPTTLPCPYAMHLI